MSILAAPRKKQKISIDPQNVNWKNSESFGKKMMSKMNWSEGKGLGKHEQGSSDNLKLNANFSGKGLGCDRDTFMKQEQWIAHHDDFASLLANLNNKSTKDDSQTEPKTNEEGNSIQNRSRSMKSRMHYKFTKGKDLTLASDKHKAGIFGKVKDDQSKPVEEEKPKQEEQVSTFESETSQLITVSTISTTDYYKEKMAKWLNKRSNVATEGTTIKESVEVKQEEIVVEEDRKEKKKKRKRELAEIETKASTEVVEEDRKEKKKKRKRTE